MKCGKPMRYVVFSRWSADAWCYVCHEHIGCFLAGEVFRRLVLGVIGVEGGQTECGLDVETTDEGIPSGAVHHPACPA